MTFFKDFFSDIGMSLDSFVNSNMYKIDTESIWQQIPGFKGDSIYESFNCFFSGTTKVITPNPSVLDL